MAIPSIMPPMLKMGRNTQSGSYGMAAAAAWVVLYTENCPIPYLFCGGFIDLTTMLFGDNIDIRLRKQLVLAGGWVAHDLTNYLGAPPAGHASIFINALPDTYGVEISARQNAGVLRTLIAEFYDAKRIGLV